MSSYTDFNQELYVEAWLGYALGCVFLISRFIVRLRTVGYKGFQGDDFCAFVSLIFFTVDVFVVDRTLFNGQNLSITEADIPNLTEADIRSLEYGSKVELVAWYSYPTLVWSLKFTMLFFYKRLTLGSFHAHMVKYLMWFCGICYFICLMVVTFGCFPYHLNWQVVPIPPWRCTFRPQNTMTICVLNIITDAAILAIPIPMLWKLKVPWRKKLIVAAILSSGLFVIAAAIVRVVVTLGGTPSGTNINRWGIRETLLGIITVSITILRPVFSKAFWRRGPYQPNGGSASAGYSNSGSRSWKAARIPDSRNRNDIELGSQGDRKPYQVGVLSHSSSQEKIIRSDREKEENVVVVHTTVNIENVERDETNSFSEDGRRGWSNICAPK